MAKSQKILIIDDDSTLAKAISELFTRKGFETIIESKADKALSLMRVQKIDGVIIDCMIPGMNGVDLGQKLREDLNFQDTMVLISGIFKDKNFAKASLRKTNAIDFMFKPLDLEKLIGHFHADENTSEEGSAGSWYGQLVEEKLEAANALAVVKDISNINFKEIPLLISMLEKHKMSVFMELTSGKDIFSIQVLKGKILNVGSNKTNLYHKEYILRENLCTSDLMDKYISDNDNILSELVEKALLSPHFEDRIRASVANSVLKNIYLSDTDFSITIDVDSSVPSPTPLVLKNISYTLHEVAETKLDPLFLKSFSSYLKDRTFTLARSFDADMQLKSLPLIASNSKFLEELKNKLSLAAIMERSDSLRLLKVLFLLQSMGHVHIKESVMSLDDLPKVEQRFQGMLDGIKGKSPEEIFNFLGVDDARSMFVAPFFKNFAKINHPDKLPQIAPDSLRKLNQQVFSIVSEAHGILTDPEKRKAYVEEVNSKKTEVILKADALKEKGQSLLKKSQYKEALPFFEESKSLHQDNRTTLYYHWCYMKIHKKIEDKNIRLNIYNELVAFPIEEKRDELFCLVMGIFKKRSKAYEEAIAEFKKSLGFNENFLPARRELMQLQSQLKARKSKTDVTNIFGADLGTVVSNIFKKKAN